jgi:hypothetical protein
MAIPGSRHHPAGRRRARFDLPAQKLFYQSHINGLRPAPTGTGTDVDVYPVLGTRFGAFERCRRRTAIAIGGGVGDLVVGIDDQTTHRQTIASRYLRDASTSLNSGACFRRYGRSTAQKSTQRLFYRRQICDKLLMIQRPKPKGSCEDSRFARRTPSGRAYFCVVSANLAAADV